MHENYEALCHGSHCLFNSYFKRVVCSKKCFGNFNLMCIVFLFFPKLLLSQMAFCLMRSLSSFFFSFWGPTGGSGELNFHRYKLYSIRVTTERFNCSLKLRHSCGTSYGSLIFAVSLVVSHITLIHIPKPIFHGILEKFYYGTFL